jgi:hypothetical protein
MTWYSEFTKVFFKNIQFYGTRLYLIVVTPITQYCLPRVDFHNSDKRSETLCQYLLDQFSQKSDNKCGGSG